ncbi:anti-sigma-F factor Fin family protein [Bacillus spongiae]|uniref:Anti-sigma-F factor Fin family protein n=1 Tax=Bacillus spongiae TaxID=2683610 RepID=A0ABU8HJP0_9BACI
MAIHYHCRHCGVKLGSIANSVISAEQLGLHKLSDKERQEMVTYQQNGDVEIQSICEDCQESLQRNPEYHGLDYLLH